MIIEAIVRRLPERFAPEASLRSLFAVTSLSLGALTWLLIAYCHQRHADIQASIDQRRALIAQHDRLQAQAADFEEQVTQARTACQLMVAKLPAHPSESEFLTMLSDNAQQFNVTLGEYRPGSIHPRQHASEMELRLRANGPYSGLCQWLDSMDRLPRMINVQHLSFVGPSTPGGDCTVDLQLMLVFAYKDQINLDHMNLDQMNLDQVK